MKTYQEFAIDYFQDEDGMFTARVPAIKGCLAWGKTLEEAYATPWTPSRAAWKRGSKSPRRSPANRATTY